MRSDGALDRRAGVGSELAAQRSAPPDHVGHVRHDLLRAPRRSSGPNGRFVRAGDRLERSRPPTRSASEGSGAGCHVGGPALDAGRRVEDHRHQVGAGDAVDHAVVDLGDERPAAVAQALDDPRLPQRPVAVELLGHEPAHEGPQLVGRSRAAGSAVWRMW